MNARFSGAVCLVLLCWVTLSAQDAGRNDQVAQPSSVANADPEYRLGPGDLIEIAVFGVDKFKNTLRISASGMIKVPLLDPVMAAGLTAAELEERLASLLDGDIIRHPQVAVFVREYKSQPVFVLGAVKSPGQYQLTQQLRLIDVLAMAGGVLPTAVDTVVIQRGPESVIQRAPESGGNDTSEGHSSSDEIIKIDLQALLGKGDLSQNIRVRGGDVVHIEERQSHVFYVIGEVNHAGAFPLPPKQPVRVTQAISAAGGPMKTAKMNQGILVRYAENGDRQQLAVDFSDILKGKKEDVMIRPDDVIFVPGSNIKNIGYGVIATAPSALASMPYALLYALRGL
jgi:polysaccharide biosynthesis/export protein